jgi:hypothetical protein
MVSKTAGAAQPRTIFYGALHRHGAERLPRHGKIYDLLNPCIRAQATFKTAAIHWVD